uniref:BTB domain-containing protein n=1 Tax=Panagrolaimus sp. ES5 TaxID=591445 RepID=A0AC34EZD0_9BILA
MHFRPFLIQDVLTIRGRGLENMVTNNKENISTESKTIYGLQSVSYFMQINYNIKNKREDDPKSDMFTVTLTFSSLDGYKLRGKIGFYVKANSFITEPDSDVFFTEDKNVWHADIFSLTDIKTSQKTPNLNFYNNGTITIHMKGIVFIESNAGSEKLQTSLGHFLWDRNDRDFIISVGKDVETKTEIKIHKNVLASRSPVFDAMLQTDMKEKAENQLEIIDFDVEVVQTAVEYFYDRDTYKSLNLGKLISLLKFADKYDIKDMKTEIEYAFLPHIYPYTICRISNVSMASKAPVLKDICIECMIAFLKLGIPFPDSELLDKDFAAALINVSSSYWNL